MKVICFGDSNTYGYDPRSYLGGRYEKEHRWVDLLAAHTGWQVENRGLNGREIPREAVDLPAGTDLFIVMLGTNDLLQFWPPERAGEKMETFLASLAISREKVLLIAPPPMVFGDWVQDEELVEDSLTLARCYQDLAARLGVRFADAGAWDVPLAFDGVHLTEDGHRRFAVGLLQFLEEEGLL